MTFMQKILMWIEIGIVNVNGCLAPYKIISFVIILSGIHGSVFNGSGTIINRRYLENFEPDQTSPFG